MCKSQFQLQSWQLSYKYNFEGTRESPQYQYISMQPTWFPGVLGKSRRADKTETLQIFPSEGTFVCHVITINSMKEQLQIKSPCLFSSRSGGCCLTNRSVWSRAAPSGWMQGLCAAFAVPLSWVASKGVQGSLKILLIPTISRNCVVTHCVLAWWKGGWEGEEEP